jgi:type I restriction enzyme S subunit
MKKARPSKNLFGFASLPEPQKPDGKATLTPKLRFPEFRDAEGWENKLIAPYLEDCSGRVPPDTKLPIYSSTREGLKRQDVYFDGRVLQNKNEYGVVPPGCLVYRHMSDDGLFKFNINETGGDIAVSKEYPVFRTKGLHPFFLLTKLNEGRDFKQFALSQKAGGTRTRLYFSRLCEWTTLLPSLPEQQRIADCLNSLDELIAAEARNLDALKTHKKGLMQQLFPREGETQPRLRFANAAEWAVVGLPEVAFFQEGPGIMAVDFRDEGVPLVRLAGVSGSVVTLSGCNYLDTEKASQKWSHFRLAINDLIISTSATFGLSAMVTKAAEGAVFYTGLIRFRPSSERLNLGYLKVFLGSPYFARQAESAAVGGGIKHFGPSHLK